MRLDGYIGLLSSGKVSGVVLPEVEGSMVMLIINSVVHAIVVDGSTILLIYSTKLGFLTL